MDLSLRLLRIAPSCLVLLTFMLLLGCASAAKQAPVGAQAEGYGGGDSGGGRYDFADDSVEAESLAPGSATISSRGRSRHRSLVDVREEFGGEASKEAPSAPEPAPEPADPEIEVELEAPGEAPKQAAIERQIIYTATMQISVHEVEHSLARVEALPERFGGWLHQRRDNQIVLRIPAERLEQAMDAIAELGVVDSRTLEALDVTAAYTDLESRIRVLTQMHAQLSLLLERAESVEQALEVRKALDALTLELELARARMRELAKSIAFSTLVVRVVARGPTHDLPSTNDPFPWVIELGVEATEYR